MKKMQSTDTSLSLAALYDKQSEKDAIFVAYTTLVRTKKAKQQFVNFSIALSTTHAAPKIWPANGNK
ncbi:MAG: hypothetical protein ACK4LR_06795 [Acidovorax temperans]|uniref:hypothetical protein n=1 Tax=Acidovorax temperans TaxID=80878 RepID=UPI00391A30AD